MEGAAINVTDVAIAAIILVSGIFALMRGFVHEVLAVGSWVGATLATLYAFPYAQPIAREVITIELLADIAAGVAIFLVVLVALSLLTRMLSRRVRESSLGPLDSSLGLLFGFVRGAVIICLLWLGFSWILPEEDWPDWVQNARSRPLMVQGAELIESLVPESLLARGDEAADEARRRADDLMEAERAFRRLNTTLPKGDARPQVPEYNDDMRQDLDSAIEQLMDDGGQLGEQGQ